MAEGVQSFLLASSLWVLTRPSKSIWLFRMMFLVSEGYHTESVLEANLRCFYLSWVRPKRSFTYSLIKLGEV